MASGCASLSSFSYTHLHLILCLISYYSPFALNEALYKEAKRVEMTSLRLIVETITKYYHDMALNTNCIDES